MDEVTLVRCAGCGVPLGNQVPSEGALDHARKCEHHPLATELAALREHLEDARAQAVAAGQRAEAAESSLASAREEARWLREPLAGIVQHYRNGYPPAQFVSVIEGFIDCAEVALSPSPAPEAKRAAERLIAMARMVCDDLATCGGLVQTANEAALREALADLDDVPAPAPAASADTREEG
jgi:hypothetical protein